MRATLPLLLLAVVAMACAPRREATVPFPPSDALSRAARILESFDYNVVELDPESGTVRGIRSAGHLSPSVLARGSRMPTPPGEILWEVTVHVTPSGDGARYRLDSRSVMGLQHLEQVDQRHLDRILEALADWRR